MNSKQNHTVLENLLQKIEKPILEQFLVVLSLNSDIFYISSEFQNSVTITSHIIRFFVMTLTLNLC